ncbi:MAG: hypothetical protein K6G32_15280 [Prevotella sp.]|nr:hypothetical protein [Prevotella sp.]
MIIIESKRKRPATILKKYPDAILADVTSGAKDGLVKLSPFYPHGGIPVPFSESPFKSVISDGNIENIQVSARIVSGFNYYL